MVFASPCYIDYLLGRAVYFVLSDGVFMAEVIEYVFEWLDALAERGPFVLLDVHSYNHRRDGADQPPATEADNPEVNVGTGSVDDDLFGPLVERFVGDLRRASTGRGPVDARENVAFEGRNLAWWVHDRYPRVGCVLALEFKKTFMDEWSDTPDDDHIAQLAGALVAAAQRTMDALIGSRR